MIINEIKNIKSEKRELRKFGITIGIFVSLIGCLPLLRGMQYSIYFFVISAFFLLFALILPNFLKIIYKFWMTLAILMGWLMTRIILSILFYVLMSPLNLLARLFGKKFLDLNIDQNVQSYWIPKKETRTEKTYYERQF